MFNFKVPRFQRLMKRFCRVCSIPPPPPPFQFIYCLGTDLRSYAVNSYIRRDVPAFLSAISVCFIQGFILSGQIRLFQKYSSETAQKNCSETLNVYTGQNRRRHIVLKNTAICVQYLYLHGLDRICLLVNTFTYVSIALGSGTCL